MSDMDPVESSELLRLQEKVRALERQNELLKTGKSSDLQGAAGAAVKRTSILSTGDDEDIKLLDIEQLDGSEENWLFDLSNGEEGFDGEEVDWLRADVLSPDSAMALKKKSLVNKLDDIAKRSPSHSGYRYGGQANGSFSTSSPYKSLTTSPPSTKYSAPLRGSQFDPRTFTRTQTGKSGSAYSLPPEDDEPKIRKPSYHRLNFGAKNMEENILNNTYGKEEGGNLTFTSLDKANTTFNKTSDNLTEHQNALNSTFDRNMSPNKDALNSTFTRNGTPSSQVNNSTFNRSSTEPASGTCGTLNATFEKEVTVNGSANHRKMSEDRMSSASSSCDVSNRLSRESSQDILVEDLDRLSTTSAMSESSVSHRLNDVQDVQDMARLQEESLKHSTPLKNPRSDTISPLSEHSLSSPVEDGGGYQSEESCGSESGVLRSGPRRGEVQGRPGQVYSSQDSLPDSPYSSQSLDSHASHGGQEVRRSMPNLNKLRGGKVGQAPSSQYGLSQAKYHNSESRLQNPHSRMAAPSYRGPPGGRSLRAPGNSGLLRPGTVTGLRPPGERKLSGIARPQGLPRPTSRLQQPGTYMRSGLAVRGGSGLGRVQGQRTDNKNWLEDCY